MKKRYKIGLVFIGVLALLLCGYKAAKGLSEDDSVETARAEVQKFVDASGKAYEFTVNPEVERNPYEESCFERQGVKLTYSDDTYTSRLGVDVSYYQGEIDWEKVKADGYDFAMIRLGYRGYGADGTLNLDKRFRENVENAKKAGLDVGVYFFAQAVNKEEAVEEAEFVLDALEEEELQMPVVYDPETVTEEEARTGEVTGEQFTRNAKAFCQRIQKAGYEPMIYCNMLWEAFELNLAELEKYPIWYADYEAFPQTPYAFDIWQYTEEGTVDGIAGQVDLNIQFLKK